jgi:protein subunit release factor B
VKFPAESPVTEKKLVELRERIGRLNVDLNAVDEQFIRASGPGGQKVNKTSSGVVLRYPPLDIVVKWTRERSRALNRFLALRELVDRIEVRTSPETSARLREQEKVREKKRRRKRKSRKKHGDKAP